MSTQTIPLPVPVFLPPALQMRFYRLSGASPEYPPPRESPIHNLAL